MKQPRLASTLVWSLMEACNHGMQVATCYGDGSNSAPGAGVTNSAPRAGVRVTARLAGPQGDD